LRDAHLRITRSGEDGITAPTVYPTTPRLATKSLIGRETRA
jgi:hypothetical protein